MLEYVFLCMVRKDFLRVGLTHLRRMSSWQNDGQPKTSSIDFDQLPPLIEVGSFAKDSVSRVPVTRT